MTETYKVKMTCSNCGYEFEKEYPKGKEVPFLKEGELCPNCECPTAQQQK